MRITRQFSGTGFSLWRLVLGYLGYQRLTCATKTIRQWHPHEFGVHPQAPPEADDSLADDDPSEDFPALNTESCSVRRSLAHLGQAIFCFADITMDS